MDFKKFKKEISTIDFELKCLAVVVVLIIIL